jgi:hypothetical protein
MVFLTASATALGLQSSSTALITQFKDGQITVTLPRAGASVRQVAELVLIRLGLSGPTLIDFNIWAGSDFLQSATDQLTKQGVARLLTQGAGPSVSLKIIIKASLIQWLQEFGLIFAQSAAGEYSSTGKKTNNGATPGMPVNQMTTADKLGEALRRSVPLLPAEAQEQIKAMLTPEALAVVVGTLIIWAGSHFFGVGEIVDVILLIGGVVFIGLGIFEGAEHLYDFVDIAINAKTDADLTRSAEHFAKAVNILGITVISALLLKKSARSVINRGRPRIYRMPNVGPVPRPGATITRPYRLPSGALGETDFYGNIQIIRNQPIIDQRVTLYHEWIHSVLSPRFGPFRQFRAQLRASMYNRSSLLTYLEEALAESFANYRVFGIQRAIVGIKFPLDGGYITISQMAAEGFAIGNIIVGGARFTVYVAYGNVTLEAK